MKIQKKLSYSFLISIITIIAISPVYATLTQKIDDGMNVKNIVPVAQIVERNVSNITHNKTDSNDKMELAGFENKTLALILARQKATLSSDMKGNITHIYVEAGDHFKKGQTLIKFDCKSEEARLLGLKAEMDKADALYQSDKKLDELDSISKLEYQQSKADLNIAKSKYLAYEHEVSFCNVIAPFNGEVVKVLQHAHHTVQVNDDLIEIVNNHSLYVEIIAPSNWLRWLKNGIKGELRLNELNRTFKIKVTNISAKIDAGSQTVEAYAKILDAGNKIKSGMSGEVRFKGLVND